jgi:hypothetical protein
MLIAIAKTRKKKTLLRRIGLEKLVFPVQEDLLIWIFLLTQKVKNQRHGEIYLCGNSPIF